MNTTKSLQQALIDYLAGLDFSGMSLEALNTYTGIVAQLDAMAKPSYADTMASLMTTMSGFGSAEKKED